MEPNKKFLDKSVQFWGLVKFASSDIGYSDRREKTLMQYTFDLVKQVVTKHGLVASDGICNDVCDYLNYRAAILNSHVENNLMDRNQAKKIFQELRTKYKPDNKLLPMNKQTKEKKHYAYFTCIINILTKVNLGKRSFVFDPHDFVIATDSKNTLVQMLSRRVDGVYPDYKNPAAVWEIKEYYGTTTFGSRVADGVYETQLDGYELKEAETNGATRIKHYLFVDDKLTWWNMGRSYLCRLVDTMHMGLVDEVIFGREVITRWPEIVKSWP